MSDSLITVVTGLPRSGTSMCMQMLEAGGLQILSDGDRAPDVDNPRGYYEYEKVKSIEKDSSWLSLAEGKAIKVVSALLQHLPEEHEYCVLFMRRPLEEILASQAAMLERRKEESRLRDREMAGHFQTHLSRVEEWLSKKSNIRKLDVDFHELLSKPVEQAERAAEFLGLSLDIEAMMKVVETDLVHHC